MSTSHDEKNLAPHHESLLLKSGLSAETIKKRGYFSVQKREEVTTLGFAKQQGNLPALVVPITDIDGQAPIHLLIPDVPRSRKGVEVKSEQPKGSNRVLHAPTVCCHRLQDKSQRLLIADSPLLADVIAQHGETVIGLIDPNAWRHHRSGMPLNDWQNIPLDGRDVLILFDSDCKGPLETRNKVELQSFLESQGAKVTFAKKPANGSPQTWGNLFQQGVKVFEIETEVSTQLYPALYDDHPYVFQEDGIYLIKFTEDGPEAKKLTNFTATIVEDIESTDEDVVNRSLRIQATLDGRTKEFVIRANEFEQMDWITRHLGVKAVITPGYGVKDHLRTAIQIHSPGCKESREIAHTGWIKTDGKWLYCHTNGVIGPMLSSPQPEESPGNSSGTVGTVSEKEHEKISVRIPPALSEFELPSPLPHDDRLRGLIFRIFRMMLADLPALIIFPLLGAVFRAVLGPNNLVIHLVGDSGCFKSAIACVMQQFFGKTMNDEQIPGNWSSTANALESLAYHLKDSLLLIDDFSPTGSRGDVQQLQRYAERLIRNKANMVGRGRSTSTGGYRGGKTPRALIVSTGEDIPLGKSLRARILTIEVNAGDIDGKKLEFYQRDANRGAFSLVMATFLQWLAPRYDEVLSDLHGLNENRSAQCDEELNFHKRTFPIVRQLYFGWEMFLEFARDVGAINETTETEIKEKCEDVLYFVAESQLKFITEADPVENLMQLIWCLFAGKRVHLLDRWTGMEPENDPECWGYRCREIRTPHVDGEGFDTHTVWHAQGRMIGWLDNLYVYFLPEALYAEVQSLAERNSISMPFTLQTMAKRLADREIFLRDPMRDRIRHRVTAEGRRQSVFKARIQQILWLSRFGLDSEEREDQDDWGDMLEA